MSPPSVSFSFVLFVSLFLPELSKLGSVHIKSESRIKAREMVEIKIESSLS